MQTRLIATLAGGFLGVALASPIGGYLGLTTTIAFLGCALAGLAIGYVASIFFDVFAGNPGVNANSQK